MRTLPDHSIGRYHILEQLGEGGMAVVYKAFDTHLEIEVAVKVIRTENIPPKTLSQTLKRFSREGRILQKLDHPHIVKVLDFGESNAQPFLVMQYLPSGTLKQYIKKRKQIPWKEAVHLLIPILEDLDYAHSQGVIHRDIKPSNILLTTSSQPMLTDFGVAKIIEEDATQDLTATSASVGTPEYMAPEQITSKSFDARADLYSLGVVFYEMITGRRPFEADTPLAVLIKHATDPLPRPSLFIPDLPESIEFFLIKALSKDPAFRFQSATDMLKASRNLLAGIPLDIPLEHHKIDIPSTNPAQLSGKKSSLKWILIGIGCISLIGLGLFLLSPIPFNSVALSPTVSPTLLASSTPTQYPSLTPSPSPLPSFTPTIEITASPSIQGEITGSVKCRFGPDEHLYRYDKMLNPQKVTLVGKNSDGSWVVFKSSDGKDTCWTTTRFVSFSEDIEKLDTIPDPDFVGKIHYGVVYAICEEYWNANRCISQPKCMETEYDGRQISDRTNLELNSLFDARSAASRYYNNIFAYRLLTVFEYTIESKYILRSEYKCFSTFDGTYYSVQPY